MENNKVRFSEIGALKTKSLESKLTQVFGDSDYEIEADESHLLLMVITKRWFSMNPLCTNNLVIVTEKQFEYILDMYNMGIPLESNTIQNFLIQCKGE